MKSITLAALFIGLAATTANAHETGIINQAGPYEATMQFYLHPAQGFPGAPDAAQQAAAAPKEETAAAATAKPAQRVASRSHRSLGIRTRYTPASQATSN